VTQTGSMLLKCLAVSIACGLATLALLYGLFVTHRELGVAPASAYRFALLVFLLSVLISPIYFKIKSSR
jgi:hypothetical protein